jgi:hypothetical protein
VIQVDHRANSAYYAPRVGQPKGTIPVSAVKLVEQIAGYVEVKNKAAINVREFPAIPLPSPVDEAESLRAQLAESSLRLQMVLDPRWKEFLALPGEIYAEGKLPRGDAFANCLARYDVVTNDARYQSLSAHAEFRETHALLLRYRRIVEGSKSSTLKLPPPPN